MKFNISNLQESVKSIHNSISQNREQLSSHDVLLEENYKKIKEALLKMEELSVNI